MSYDEPDAVDDFEGAQEHGHALGEYIGEQDGYVHKDDSFRNEDGTWRRRTARQADGE